MSHPNSTGTKTGTKMSSLVMHNGQLIEKAAMNINISDIPGDDPLGFAFGFQQGYGGFKKGKADPGDTLAPAYLKGYALGKKVLKGTAPMPAYVKVL